MGNICPCPKRKQKHPSYDLHEETFEIEQSIDTPGVSKQKQNTATHRSNPPPQAPAHEDVANEPEPEKESIIQAEQGDRDHTQFISEGNITEELEPKTYNKLVITEASPAEKAEPKATPAVTTVIPDPPIPVAQPQTKPEVKPQKVYSFGKKNIDPNNYRFLKQTGVFKTKQIDSIKQQQFNIDSCENCVFFIFDLTANVYVDKCSDCFIFCAPCESTVFLRDCKNIKMIGITKQFRVRDCFDCEFSLYCKSQPVIESSNNIVFTPYPQSLGYTQLLGQFSKSRMEVWNNHWSEIHDFTKKAGEKHFALHQAMSYEIPDWARAYKEANLEKTVAPTPYIYGDLELQVKQSNIYIFNKQGSSGENEERLLNGLIQNKIWLTKAFKGKLPSEAFSVLQQQYPDCQGKDQYVCIKISNTSQNPDTIQRFETLNFDDFYALIDSKQEVARLSPLIFPTFKDEH